MKTTLTFAIVCACVATISTSVQATILYTFPGPAVIGTPGPILPDPGRVNGKEFSHFTDRDMAAAADPSQVVAWDGAGGVTDGVDFTSVLPPGTNVGQVDALAHRRDLLFNALRGDSTYLLFSAGNGTSPVGTGLLTTTEGETIGYAGEINYETPGGPTKGRWATGSQIDGMVLPVDVDGVEIWGPEPPASNADRFSLQSDFLTGTSVFTGSGASYIAHSTIVGAVASLLGSLPPGVDQNQIDLDALMSLDADQNDQFGPGDSIIFSIRQVLNPGGGFYATGSELFTLDATAAGLVPGYLTHGGHVWDHAYSLLAMRESVSGRQLDINAIEAASVPEPSAFVLLALVSLIAARRSRSRD